LIGIDSTPKPASLQIGNSLIYESVLKAVIIGSSDWIVCRGYWKFYSLQKFLSGNECRIIEKKGVVKQEKI